MLSALLDRRNSYLKWAIGTVAGTADEPMVANCRCFKIRGLGP